MTHKKGEMSERERQRRLAQAASQKDAGPGQKNFQAKGPVSPSHPGAVPQPRIQKATNRGQ